MNYYHDEDTKRLIKVFSLLKNENDIEKFINDLCTIKEIKDMSKRLLCAVKLINGEVYQDIIDETGISSATLSRINQCIKYGDGGYKKAIDLL